MTTMTMGSRHIEEIIEYIVCPAKCFISTTNDKLPDKEKMKKSMRFYIQEVIMACIAGKRPEDIDISYLFEDIKYDKIHLDVKAIETMTVNFFSMMALNEYTIHSPGQEFESYYGAFEVKSYYDCLVKDTKTDRIFPLIIDTSKTRYDPEYNPIVYRCQTVADYMETKGTNTNIVVFTIPTHKYWNYNVLKYNEMVSSSILETCLMIHQDLYPARFSWICAGCSYRGICHQLTKGRIK